VRHEEEAANPLYLWSFTDAKMVETWSDPIIGKVKLAGAEKFVAFVGGGYDTAQNNRSGKAVFAIDLATGTKLWEYYNATGSTDDRQYMNFSLPAGPTAVDLNLDGYIDRVYIGLGTNEKVLAAADVFNKESALWVSK
jgi:type IV pilus assembly protein PilY1